MHIYSFVGKEIDVDIKFIAGLNKNCVDIVDPN